VPTLVLGLHNMPDGERRCHESAEYLEAAAQRRKDGASELEIVIVESI